MVCVGGRGVHYRESSKLFNLREVRQMLAGHPSVIWQLLPQLRQIKGLERALIMRLKDAVTSSQKVKHKVRIAIKTCVESGLLQRFDDQRVLKLLHRNWFGLTVAYAYIHFKEIVWLRLLHHLSRFI